MTDSTSNASNMHSPAMAPRSPDTDATEPLGALLVGGVAGAACFALCVFLFGPVTGIVIAVVAAIGALVRRSSLAATTFVAAAVLSGVALIPLTIAIFAAALSFGEGLILLVRAPRRKSI
ncbi:MAG: hypothetical protein ABI446_07910 [Gemmatimonadaceae bacterium]